MKQAPNELQTNKSCFLRLISTITDKLVLNFVDGRRNAFKTDRKGLFAMASSTYLGYPHLACFASHWWANLGGKKGRWLLHVTRPLFMHPIGQHNGLLLGYRIYDERAPAIPSIKTSLFLISTPEHKPVFKPEPNGHWEHPSFRWSLIPPGAEYGTFFADIGYEITYCTRDIDDDPFEMECIGWEPEALGFGWFLVKITKDKNGQPLAIFAKQNTSTATLFSSNTSMR